MTDKRIVHVEIDDRTLVDNEGYRNCYGMFRID